MGGLFSKPKVVKPPPVPPPLPVPVVGEEPEEQVIRESRGRSGFEQTFLTGNLTPKPTGRKRTLG